MISFIHIIADYDKMHFWCGINCNITTLQVENILEA